MDGNGMVMATTALSSTSLTVGISWWKTLEDVFHHPKSHSMSQYKSLEKSVLFSRSIGPLAHDE